MDILPRIGRPERRDLLQMGRKSGDPATALHFQIIARLGLRKTSSEVAEELDVARSTVVRTAHRYAEEGLAGLYDKRRGNGKPKADEGFRHHVIGLLRRTTEDVGFQRPTWTRELLQMTRDGWARVSVGAMGRALAHVGARLGMPNPVVLCPWKRDARERRLDELRALERGASAEEPVLYSTRSTSTSTPRSVAIGCSAGNNAASSPRVRTRSSRLAGALDVRTGVLHATGTTRKTAALFCDLLKLLANSYGAQVRRIHLIVDNDVIHSARATRRTFEELGHRIVLHFLPPYCPDANRIERVWQDLHANVTRNHRCKTMKALLSKARTYVEGYVWRRVTGLAAILQRAA